MKAKHLVLVNWGNLPIRTYPLHEITAITGETGSGKTSILDGIIALMSGGQSTIGRLNMASEDGNVHRQQSKAYRQIPEYVLGAHKAFFARTSAHGYVVIAWEPEFGEEALPFTSVFGASAQLVGRDAKLVDEHCLALVVGESLDDKEFAIEEGGQRIIVPTTECVDRLRGKYGIRKGQRKTGVLSFTGGSTRFLQHLYGFFRGREELSEVEARRCAMVFCRFIPQEGIEDVSEFMRKLIMPDPRTSEGFIGIRQQMKTNRDLARRAKELAQQKRILEKALKRCRDFTMAFIRARTLEFRMLQGAKVALEAEDGLLRRQNEDSRKLICLKEEERRSHDQALEEAQLQVAQLTATLKGYKIYADREAYQSEIAEARLKLAGEREKAERLYAGIERALKTLPTLEMAAQGADQLSQLGDTVHLALAEAKLSSKFRIDPLAEVRLLTEEPNLTRWHQVERLAKELETPFVQVRERLCGVARRLVNLIAPAEVDLQRERNALETRLMSLRAEAAELETRREVAPPPWAVESLEYVKRNLPESNPLFLYQLVKDVKDPDWQMAIEGRIGNARFNIVVDPRHELPVNNLLRRFRGEGTLVQGRLLLKAFQERVIERDSIVHDLVVDNRIARAFLLQRFGAVMKVPDDGDIMRIPNGIQKDGRSASGFTTRNVREHGRRFYFGVRAVEKRRRELAEELASADKERIERANVATLLTQLRAAEKIFFDLGDDTIELCAGRAKRWIATIETNERKIRDLDTSAFGEIEKRRDYWQKVERDAKAALETLGQTLNAEHTAIGDRERRLKEIEIALPVAEEAAIDALNRLMEIRERAYWVPIAEIQTEVEKLIEGRSASAPLNDLIQKQRSPMSGAMSGLGLDIQEYNVSPGVQEPISVADLQNVDPEESQAFELIVKKHIEIDSVLRSIKTDKLAGAAADLSHQGEVMRKAFTQHFCQHLLAEIQKAEEALDRLNRDLRTYTFGQDRYRFAQFPASPEFARRLAFFGHVKEQIDKDESYNPLEDTGLPPEMIAVRNEIVRLLTSDDEKDIRELERLTDYRNYHTYEMYKVFLMNGEQMEIPMSKNAKDSGGEKENGILIARSATIASALELDREGPHLHFVAIDEMMKKTDEERIRESVRFLSEQMRLQVLFVMPTRSIGPFKDLADAEYNVARVHTSQPEGELQDKVVVSYVRYNREQVLELRERLMLEVRERTGREFDTLEPEKSRETVSEA